MPASTAACLTGPIRSLRPRPAPRSGWARTTTGRHASLPTRAASAGRAKAGVPAKTMRIKPPRARAWRPCACAASCRSWAPERRQIVDEQLAVEMVNLVLYAHRLQSLGLQLERLAVNVQRPHKHGRSEE